MKMTIMKNVGGTFIVIIQLFTQDLQTATEEKSTDQGNGKANMSAQETVWEL